MLESAPPYHDLAGMTKDDCWGFKFVGTREIDTIGTERIIKKVRDRVGITKPSSQASILIRWILPVRPLLVAQRILSE